MNWQQYGQKDTKVATVGDFGWKGIDMIHEPGSVPEGYLTRAENKRLRDGTAATRLGVTTPGDFNPEFANKIIGSGIFSNPAGTEVMLVATLDATYVWALEFGKDPIKINLFAGQNTGTHPLGFVHFVQAFDKVMLLRFPLGVALVWDGVAGNTFDPVNPAPVPHDPIPNEIMGVPFQSRVLLYSPYYPLIAYRDTFIMTDPLDVTQYDKILSTFRINAGESDIITCVTPYFKGGAIVFMRDSVHMVENFTIDPFLTSQRLLNSRLGAVPINQPFMDGSDIIYLSRSGKGFYRVSEIDEQNIAALPRPISWLIQPVIDRINWDQAILWACSEGLGDYAYFLVPLDDVTGGSNAICVYNTVTREWESAPDTFGDPNFKLNTLLVTLYDGQRQLFGIDYDGRKVCVLNFGLEDELNGDHVPIHDRMATRGYGATSMNRFQRALMAVRTYAPEATVSARTDGFNEVKRLATITKDQNKFYVHGHKRFDPLVDDPDEPRREDYSIDDTDSAIEDFEGLPDGPLPYIPATPLQFTGNKQQTVERFQVRQTGRWCSLEIENTHGQCDVVAAGVELIPAKQTGIGA